MVPVTADEIYDKVELLRDLLSRSNGDAWAKPASRLHSVLIEPIENAGWLDGITWLYIVPNGLLHYVPFAALPRTKSGEPRYLIDDFTVTHLPQASVLAERAGDPTGSSLLALAPSTSGVPFAAREVEHLAALYDGAEILVGRDARESAFKARAGEFRRLHLATHGTFDPWNPLRSGVELEPGDGEDGRLEVREIFDLRLDADLVALSACETGLGSGYFTDIPAGDELVSLSRAFLYAGSRSVLATLWKVDDRSTLDLMRVFYERLEREGPGAALATAQRALRSGEGSERHPYFWAGFVLVHAPT
jgi:CHAT domain-containing protein